MNCRKCDRELAAGEEKMVAQWVFCEQCFTALLEKKDVAEEQMEEQKSDCCHLCKKTLQEGQTKKVGLWNFCSDCFGDLNKPARLTVSLNVAPNECKSIEEENTKEEIVVLQTKYINCAQCGRRVPERGTKERAGERFCPDCFFTKEAPPAMPAGQPEIQVAVEVEAPADIPSDKCMSCQRQGGELRMVKGFPLCPACLVSDENLALEIAKKRHRKMMEQLKEELD